MLDKTTKCITNYPVNCWYEGGYMVGIIIFLLLVLLELGFMIWDIRKGLDHKREKYRVRIAVFLIFLVMVISPVITWNFTWYGLGLFLLVQAIFAVIGVIKKKVSSDKKRSKLFFKGIGRGVLLSMVVFPVILFPPMKQILPSGEYAVGTAVYTWKDEAREEAFTEIDDKRKVTVQFYYPTDEEVELGTAAEGADIIAGGKYPLILFSHGAFGYRRSNYSAYMELASHGYVVCSIDHTYHAFFTKEQDGKTVTINLDFLNQVLQLENNQLTAEQAYQATQEWMNLRTEDMKFVLNQITLQRNFSDADELFQGIDMEHIGAFGHSLGGAASAQIGRELNEIDAVIVLDGTMLGEEVGMKDGSEILMDTPYPKPILNFYNESHYEDAMKAKDIYANTVATENALDAYQVVINGSGHLNFTDLPILSPILAGMLGTGEVDARRCILNVNETVLEFFDHYLKDSPGEIPRERIY